MKKIELRAKQFAERYVANNMNGTQTAVELYNAKERKTAQSIATENLSKPVMQKAIVEEMEKQGLDDKTISEIMNRNVKQKQSYSASNTAIDIYHKVKGTYAPEKKETINLNLTGVDLKDAIRDTMSEIKELENAL